MAKIVQISNRLVFRRPRFRALRAQTQTGLTALGLALMCVSSVFAATSTERSDTLLFSPKVGLASWYGGGEALNTHTASGSRFDPEKLEAAMWGLPFGTYVRVINLKTGKSVTVRITDRGPSKKLDKRVIDLTRAAFEELAALRLGLIPVAVVPLSSRE